MRALRRLTPVLLLVGALLLAPAAPAAAEQVPASVAGVREGPSLGLGARGDEVAEWQRALNAWLGRYPQGRRAVVVDGVFGPRTSSTTRAFQSWAEIAVDGIVGGAARRAMHRALDDGPVRAREVLPSSADTGDDFGRSTPPAVTVTDVRVTSHAGFERVTFTLAGEGRAGWDVGYEQVARSRDGGEVDLAGDAVLAVTLRNIALPRDAAAGAWDGPERLRRTTSGPVDAVLDDGAATGTHRFFIGVGERTPFEVRRFEAPQRVVVDVAR